MHIKDLFSKFVVVDTLQHGNKNQLGGWVRYKVISKLEFGCGMA